MEILWAVLILLGLGLLLGIGLAVAAKILYVKEDERIGEVEKKLPVIIVALVVMQVAVLWRKPLFLVKKKTLENVVLVKKILTSNQLLNI